MIITALAENTSCRDNITSEHGLSLYIETQARRILFDMGQTDLFAHNADILNIDLSAVDIAVLSHGHYDHGGGLRKFMDINRSAPIYMSRHAFDPHYNGTEKYIGLDTALRDNDRIIFTDDIVEIGIGLTLYSCNDREKKHDPGSFGLTERVGEDFIPDDFRHEQYLLIEEEGKRVLISGCSHKGIVDIAEWFAPDVLVGGFHFSKLSAGDILAGYAKRLASFDTDYYTCHCTGIAQFEFMKRYMDRLFYLSAGQTIEI